MKIEEMTPSEISAEAVTLAAYVKEVMNSPGDAPLPDEFCLRTLRLAELVLEMVDCADPENPACRCPACLAELEKLAEEEPGWVGATAPTPPREGDRP